MFYLRIVLCCAFCACMSLPAADALRFGAFSIDTGISGLIERYPRSRHEFWSPDGHAVFLSDSSAEFRDLIAHGTGRYAVRMLPEEVRQDVHYIDAAIEGGVVKSVRLSFEKPDGGRASPARGALGSFEDRHPACRPLLSDLTRQYGRPQGPLNSSEERLENRKYFWKNDREELALVCGHYFGRTRVFAMDVILTRLGN